MTTDSLQRIHDVNVAGVEPLIAPSILKAELPLTEAAAETVLKARDEIAAVIRGEDQRLLVVVGPCSIHDEKAALEYAGRLHELADKVSDRLLVVMRVYFEKPRTTTGWKGLINDPHLDGSFDIATGLRLGRKLLIDINSMGLPAATEMLDPITPQYIDDLIAWASIGARTTESQTHRQMSSGLSMPVGYKNGTDGNLNTALNAMQSAGAPHHFLGIDGEGRTCVIKTKGNPLGHLILRGGSNGPNYDPWSLENAAKALKNANLPEAIVIDCNHANSGKKHKNQQFVWRSVLDQRTEGNKAIAGMMLESNLNEGNQPFPKTTDGLKDLKYGVSLTDECSGWEKTEALIRLAHESMGEVLQ